MQSLVEKLDRHDPNDGDTAIVPATQAQYLCRVLATGVASKDSPPAIASQEVQVQLVMMKIIHATHALILGREYTSR